jgi:DNA repair exonuclease SbcCD nuclease subunit
MTTPQHVAVIGDPHIGRKVDQGSAKTAIDAGQLAFFRELAQECRTRGISDIIITGDMFDTRTSISITGLMAVNEILGNILKDFKVHLIAGNHDLAMDDSYEFSALRLYSHYSHVTIHIDSMGKLQIGDKTWYFVPWVIPSRMEKFVGWLESMAKKPAAVRKNTVILGHFECMGIKMEGSQISQVGIDPNLLYSAADTVISGHFHGPHLDTKGDGKFLWAGTPYQLTFANAGAKHGAWFVGSDGTFEQVENLISPKFVDITDIDDDIPESLANCFVRLFVSSGITAEAEFKLRTSIDARGPILVKTVPYSTDVGEVGPSEAVKESTKILAMDVVDLSRMWIESNPNTLPVLTTHASPKDAVIAKVRKYEGTINARK